MVAGDLMLESSISDRATTYVEIGGGYLPNYGGNMVRQLLLTSRIVTSRFKFEASHTCRLRNFPGTEGSRERTLRSGKDRVRVAVIEGG
jgi:hypothetical protein